MHNNSINSASVQGNLRIDKVLTSQPELGPIAPDGGYGWIILIAGILLQLAIPGITIAYGIFILFYRLETNNEATTNLCLWDNQLIYTPLALLAVWSISDPWTKKMIRSSSWPRLVATSGICLTCCGLLITWMAIKHNTNYFGFITAGMLSGIGISLTMNQTDSIIRMYFRMKLGIILSILQATKTIGYVLLPMTLGKLILQDGILKVLILYQTVLLQGLIIVLVFKKPAYLKAKRRSYKLIQEVSDDDEDDVFAARSITEMQQTVHSINRYSAVSDIGPEQTARHGCPATPMQQLHQGFENASEHHRYTPPFELSHTDNREFHDPENIWNDEPKRQGETGLNSLSANVQHKTLHDSFADDFQADLDRIENFNDIPRPLFTDVSIHNDNTTYSYDNFDTGGYSRRSSHTVFAAVPNKPRTCCIPSQTWETIKYPSFYKSLFSNVTLQASTFIFWCLFPSYLYAQYDNLQVAETTVFISCVAAGSLLYSISSVCVTIQGKTRAILLATFSFIGSGGYAVLGNMEGDIWLVFGGLHVALSITALQSLSSNTILNSKSKAQKNRDTVLGIATGLIMLLTFTTDVSYINCFRIMSLLHFINGALWFTNYVFKKIKKVIYHPHEVSTIPSQDSNRE